MGLWNKWALKGLFAIVDHGISSGANFTFSILLARWCSPAEYGSFAIAFSIFLFAAGFHNATVLEPMSVIAPARLGENLGGYVRSSLKLHALVVLCLAILSLLTMSVLRLVQHPLADIFVGLSVGMPLILTFWFVRRSCYLESKPENAIKGSSLYAFVLVFGAYIARSFGLNFTSTNAFFLMGLASATVSIWMWSYGRPLVSTSGTKTTAVAVLASHHWSYGRWVIGSAFVHWSVTTVYLPLVGIFAGLFQAGGYRALQNLFLPLHQTFTALGTLLLPWIARQRGLHGINYVKKAQSKMLLASLTVSCAYCILLSLAGVHPLRFLYNSDQYNQFLWLVPYLCCAVLAAAVISSLSIGLKALERPKDVFWAQAAGSAFTLTLGFCAVYFFGLVGAAVGSLMASLITAVALVIFMFSAYSPS